MIDRIDDAFISLLRDINYLISEEHIEMVTVIKRKARNKKLMQYLGDKYNNFLFEKINEDYPYDIDKMNEYIYIANEYDSSLSTGDNQKNNGLLKNPYGGLSLLIHFIINILEMPRKEI